MNAARAVLVSLLCTGLLANATPTLAAGSAGPLLDSFESVDAWSTFASDSVTASLRQAPGVAGKALCLAYDFNGVSGYAVARRKLPIDYPANYEYTIQLRGAAPANNLEFKLSDASGENVWWTTRPNYSRTAWRPASCATGRAGARH